MRRAFRGHEGTYRQNNFGASLVAGSDPRLYDGKNKTFFSPREGFRNNQAPMPRR